MIIHQIIVRGPFDRSGRPKPEAEILTTLAPASLQRCLDLAAGVLAIRDEESFSVQGTRLFFLPETNGLRLLGEATYEYVATTDSTNVLPSDSLDSPSPLDSLSTDSTVSTENVPQLRGVHLLVVGADLEEATELPNESLLLTPQSDVLGDALNTGSLAAPSEDLSSLHGDLFSNFTGSSTSKNLADGLFDFEPPKDTQGSSTDFSDSKLSDDSVLNDAELTRNLALGGDAFLTDDLQFPDLLPVTPSSSDASSSDRLASSTSSPSLSTETGSDSDDFELSDSSSDALFTPNEEDLPLAASFQESEAEIPVEPKKKPRVPGPQNVVARAMQLAAEREGQTGTQASPLNATDFERIVASQSSENSDEEDEFDHLVLTSRGIVEKSNVSTIATFVEPTQDPSEFDTFDTDSTTSSNVTQKMSHTLQQIDSTEKDEAEAAENVEDTQSGEDDELTQDVDSEKSVASTVSDTTDEEAFVVPDHAHLPSRAVTAEEIEWDPAVTLRLFHSNNWFDTSILRKQFSKLPQFLGKKTPAIADEVFRNFLICDGDDPMFDDPGDIIPDRWRLMSPRVRRQYFEEFFTRLLRVYTDDQQMPKSPTIGLIAEPAIASLLFYGVCRLLPESPIRHTLSFSTLEPTTQALGKTSEANDTVDIRCRLLSYWSSDLVQLRQSLLQRLQSPEFASKGQFSMIDTLASQPPQSKKISIYVESLVHRLCEQGWSSLLPRIQGMVPMHPQTLPQLETAMLVERAVSSLLNRGQFPNEQWRKSPQAMGRFRRELLRRLEQQANPEDCFRSIVGGTSHLPTLELIMAKDYPSELRVHVEYLLSQVPSEKMLQVFRRPNLPNEDKIVMLSRHIHDKNGTLPPGFEFLWEDWANYAHDKTPQPTALIIARVLRRLDPEDMGPFMRACPHGRLQGFVESVLALYKQNRLTRHSVSAMWAAMNEATFVRLLRQEGCDFIRTYPKEEHGFGERLGRLILTIPQYPEEFTERLEWLLAGQHHLSEEYQDAVDNWSLFATQVQKVAKLQKVDANQVQDGRIRMLISATRDMARAADQAMNFKEIDQDFAWSNKRDVMYRIASQILDGKSLFEKGPWEHDELMLWIDVQFRERRWPTETFKKGSLIKEKAKILTGAAKVETPGTSPVFMAIFLTIIGLIILGAIYGVYTLYENYGYEEYEEYGEYGTTSTDGTTTSSATTTSSSSGGESY